MKYQLVKLEKLCKIQSGGTPRRGVDGFYGGNIPWAKIGDIENAENGYLFNTIETITPAGLKSINNKIFPKNTVLLAMYGSVGKTSITGLEMTTNQAILGLQPNDQNILHFNYLRYWLDFSKNELIKKARGVALQNISATLGN
jgi:type I restriction enzyme S subunit